MKKIIKAFLNKETILYLIFGFLTTALGFVTLKLFDMALGQKLYLISNSLSWVLCVAFAFVTNKLFVFESKEWKTDILKKEIPSFLRARIASYFIEQGGLWLMMDILLFKERIFDFFFFRLNILSFYSIHPTALRKINQRIV